MNSMCISIKKEAPSFYFFFFLYCTNYNIVLATATNKSNLAVILKPINVIQMLQLFRTFCKRSTRAILMPVVSRPRFSSSAFRSHTLKSVIFLPTLSDDIFFSAKKMYTSRFTNQFKLFMMKWFGKFLIQ